MSRIVLICCLLGSMSCIGQQSPQYSQYIRNQYMVNPGATGAYDYLGITLGGRAQWLGFENAPKTSYLYFSAPVNKLKGAFMKRTFGKKLRSNKRVRHPVIRRGKLAHAVGGHLLADQYGAFRTLKLMGSYAVHIPVTSEYTLSFGTNVGLSSRSFLVDKAKVLSVMTNTGIYDQTYSSYSQNNRAQYTLDLEAGLYFYGKDAFVGFSANQLTGDLVKFGNRTTNFDPKMHFFFTGGYKFQINQKIAMTPAVLLKYVSPAPLSVEGSLQFDYMERFWFGASYRHKAAVVVMVGAVISNKFKVGYSFDISTTKLINHSSGGHELVLGLMLGRSSRGTVRF
jgi:type IX secretion system PorP/SprF family membrane protein